MIRSVAVLTCLWWLPLGAWSVTAQAQTVLMRDVTVKKVLQAETLSGCSIKFDVGYRDHTYRQGLPSVVSGDVTWYLRPMGAWASLTVTGQDISAEMEPMGDFLITNAFIDVDTSTYLADEQSSCESPLGFCAVYRAEKATRLMHSAIPAFALGFDREGTRMGRIRLPIVIEGQQLKDIEECLQTLAGSVTPEQP